MSASFGGIEKARARVTWLWDELARIARLACVLWPWHNSPGHIAAAQFELEVKRARCASGEKGGARDYPQDGVGVCSAGLAGGPASQSQARRVLMPQEELQLLGANIHAQSTALTMVQKIQNRLPVVGEMARCQPWHSHRTGKRPGGPGR